jgi:hypothetical protein
VSAPVRRRPGTLEAGANGDTLQHAAQQGHGERLRGQRCSRHLLHDHMASRTAWIPPLNSGPGDFGRQAPAWRRGGPRSKSTTSIPTTLSAN